MLSAIYTKLCHLEHVTAQKGAKHPKRFKGKGWPSPRTGMDELRKKVAGDARRRSADYLERFFERVPTEQWRAEIDAAKASGSGALTVGQSGEQMAERAREQRRAAGLPDPPRRLNEGPGRRAAARHRNPAITRGGLGVSGSEVDERD